MINPRDVEAIIEWNKNNLAWIDYDKFLPRPTYWVKLGNGQEVRAVYAFGEWETLDGCQLTGVRQWQPLSVDGVSFK